MNIDTEVEQEAFKALQKGEKDRHDELLIQSAKSMANKADVLILAQASMARLVPRLADLQIPILTSPELAVKRALKVLEDDN